MMILYASVTNPGITLSVFLFLPGYIAPPDTTPSAGSTNNLIRQMLSSNRTQAVPLAVSLTMTSTGELIRVDGTFYCHINTTKAQYDRFNHGNFTAMSSLIDVGANSGMTGSDVHVIFTLDFHDANVIRIRRLPSMTFHW
jgi:hypothetical protein